MNEETHQKKIKREYLFYYLGIAVLIIGISLLPLTFSWLSSKQHIPIILLAIGISVIIIGLLQRQPVDKNIFDTKAEEILKAQEQITDHVIKRIRWFAIIIAVLGVFGVAGYIRMTFDPQLTKITLASGELEQIKKDYKEIRNQKHEIDSLQKVTINLNEANANLKSSLESQENYIKKRIQIFDSTFEALSQKNPNAEKILDRGREIDKTYLEIIENRNYELSIHYFESRIPTQNIERIANELRSKGFNVFTKRKNEVEKRTFVGQFGNLFRYSREDSSKAESIVEIFNSNGIKLEHKTSNSDPKKAKSFDIWP